MELDRAKDSAARMKEWRAMHVDAGDGKCAACSRAVPCLFAIAATPGLRSPAVGHTQ